MYLRNEADNGRVTPIAIVGAALAFPGACDPVSFHELTIAGRRMFRELAGTTPGQGANAGNHAIAAPNGNAPSNGAALRDSTALDNLLARRTAAAALTDVPPEGRSIGQGKTGVIIADNPGHGTPSICAYVREQLGLAHAQALARAEAQAPSCSLRAVAAACDVLSSGALDLVLAGGVSMGIDPEWMSRRADAGSLAAEDIRVYDVSPTGTLPGEGCGVVALMRAADAQAARLPVYAEIAGWNALEHAAPEGVPQPAAIRTAYLRAGVDPADVQFVEGHGAATEADDLAELTALLEILAPRADGARGGCALGAVSANIGDTRAAAGVAALLKTALAMAAGIIPPATGCVRPHPLLLQAKAPFRLPSEPESWPEAGIQLAAVNSLGIVNPAGGVRSGPVHLVLRREQDPGRRPGRRRRPHSPVPSPNPEPLAAPVGDLLTAHIPAPRPSSGPMPVAPLSKQATAETVVALHSADRVCLAATLDAIAITAERLSPGELRQFALKLAATPPADYHGVRAAIVASDPAQLAERARTAAAMLRSAKPETRAWPQTAGPGIYLAEGALGRVALVFPGLASTPLEHTTMLSASMATLSALDRLGVQPRLAVGHSFGEITGLAWAGCITFGEAARLAAHRAEILRAAPHRTAMARVLAAPRVVARLCGGTGLALAVSEGPRQQVLAGSAGDIRMLLRRAAALGVSANVLEVTCALHSSAMRPCVAPLRAVTAGMRITVPQRRLISTSTGFDVTVSEDIPGLLARQITRPALLAGALALASANADLILLASPEPAVASAAAAGDRLPVVQAPLERRSVPVPAALAALFAAGALSDLRPSLDREAAHTGRT